MGGKKTVVISCFGENTELYHKRILVLFKTLKHFGGKMAEQKCMVYFNQSVDPSIEKELKDLGVDVRISQPFDVRSPCSNKVRMLEIDNQLKFDVLLLLDCDIAVARDFTKQIKGDRIQAAPVYVDFLSRKQWKLVFSTFDIPFPKKKMETFLGNKTVPYFNSGVIAIPRQYVEPLRKLWKKYILLLLDHYEGELLKLAEQSYFTDQIALTLALQDGKFPFSPFPLKMNFQTNQKVHEKFSPDSIRPYIIHYHKRFMNNRLRKIGYKKTDALIRKINKFIGKGYMNK
ncbi:hypothetical protein [Ammoniphilus sp. CFH 90114]|uniref:hypothetical protein n=1 Tax=Ammoniphilus sp. CFH 90114 TaxID=2493665 RepID=UPI00100F62A3|nr:hypothetical protein [Ammoniphilus sp. CFH 90114]RXT13982.1 hypothetical protein EIZ39_07560 [Ammoniphilus sp. CFH 90114]